MGSDVEKLSVAQNYCEGTLMIENESTNTALKLDLLSIISIAVIVYIIQNVLHEFIGHGGATILVGGKLVSLTTAYLQSNLESASSLGRRIVAAAGPIVNTVAGILFWIILKKQYHKKNSLTFFLWLLMSVNLFTGLGYFLFSGVSGIGDWITVLHGVENIWMWRIIMIIAGIILYMLAIWISLRELNLFIGADEPHRGKRALKLSLIPYLFGSFFTTIGALFNPESMLFVITSAASTFGGTSALAWMTQLYSTSWFSKIDEQPIIITRNWYWIVAAAILLFVHAFILGPGIMFL